MTAFMRIILNLLGRFARARTGSVSIEGALILSVFAVPLGGIVFDIARYVDRSSNAESSMHAAMMRIGTNPTVFGIDDSTTNAELTDIVRSVLDYQGPIDQLTAQRECHCQNALSGSGQDAPTVSCPASGASESDLQALCGGSSVVRFLIVELRSNASPLLPISEKALPANGLIRVDGKIRM